MLQRSLLMGLQKVAKRIVTSPRQVVFDHIVLLLCYAGLQLEVAKDICCNSWVKKRIWLKDLQKSLLVGSSEQKWPR